MILFIMIFSGLNTWLGSQILTESGFILNNALTNGGVNHERRPLSFSSPVIAVQKDEVCGRRLVLGNKKSFFFSKIYPIFIV